MDMQHFTSGSWPGRRYAWLLLLLVLCFQLPTIPARAQPAPAAAVPAAVTAPLLAEGWSWRKLFAPIESTLSNRRRMIQFATIGMCIGLYILMRK